MKEKAELNSLTLISDCLYMYIYKLKMTLGQNRRRDRPTI